MRRRAVSGAAFPMNDRVQMKQEQPPQTSRATPLFRSEAVAYQTRQLDGEVMLSLTMRTRVLIALAVVVVGAALVFVSTASYSRIETVAGWVVPEGGLIRVTAQQGGTVERLLITEGDSVRAGQPLAEMRLSPDLEGGDSRLLLERHLQSQALAQQAQAEAEREKLLAEEASLKTARLALRRELDAGRLRIGMMERRLEIARANSERVGKIAERGYSSARNAEEAQMGVLLAQQDLADAEAAVMALQRELDTLDANLRAVPTNLKAAEAQARASDAALARQATELEAQGTYQAGATVAGRVVAVPVARGQTVAAQSVLAVITPEGSTLEAELYVPSRAAGFINPGQEVRLMYQAFPYQKFGTARGQIRSVSHTVLAPSEVSIPSLNAQEPVFRVKVALDSDSVEAYGQTIPVQPGMLLQAGIVIERRTLIEWLLDPLYAVGRMG